MIGAYVRSLRYTSRKVRDAAFIRVEMVLKVLATTLNELGIHCAAMAMPDEAIVVAVLRVHQTVVLCDQPKHEFGWYLGQRHLRNAPSTLHEPLRLGCN